MTRVVRRSNPLRTHNHRRMVCHLITPNSLPPLPQQRWYLLLLSVFRWEEKISRRVVDFLNKCLWSSNPITWTVLGRSYSRVSKLQPRAKSSQPCLCNKVIWEHSHAHSFGHCLWLVSHYNRVAKPNLFAIWLFKVSPIPRAKLTSGCKHQIQQRVCYRIKSQDPAQDIRDFWSQWIWTEAHKSAF